MQLTGITRLIARLEPVRSLTGSARIHGLLKASRPAVAAALAHIHSGPVVLVTAHPQTAQDLWSELPTWTDVPVALFPAIDALPYERVRLDRTVLAQRESAVRNVVDHHTGFLVAPIRACLQPLRSMSSGETARPLVLSRGDTISIDKTVASWVERGYAHVPLVEEPGTFARRGGVVDVFPAGDEAPIRLELFGSEIDSLRAFDPATQRSLHPVESVSITTIASVGHEVRMRALERLLLLDTSALTAEAQSAWLDDLARLESGASFDELAIFGPYLQPDARSLAQLLPPDTLVLVDDADTVWQTMRDLAEQAEAVQRGMVEAGIVPPGLSPALIDFRVVEKAFRAHQVIEWLPGTGNEDELDWSSLFSPAKLYGGRVRVALTDLREAPGTTVVTSHQHERIAELLDEEHIPVAQLATLQSAPAGGIHLLPGSAGEGWRLPSAALQLIGDHELFGRSLARPVVRQRRPARDAFFAGFSPGDYVVHLEHGIGRFEGITRMALDGVEREYGLVQYAGADRVYVPTDQLERLTRYIGSSESAPPLNKLGGGEWQRARLRAKKAADDIARELIDVYARRMARPAHAFSPDTPWQHELESAFPFAETPDQVQAIAEVKVDMEEPRPMDRLVCADVGYGKTEVAVRAAFKALMDGKQVAVLVPTTILAQQHFETFSERFAGFPATVEVLSRFRSPTQQRETLRRLAAGQVDVIIGTHRLLSKDVDFKTLGLLIIDEEQRFGVRHKEQLRKMREAVDVLTLTATPIPRTLHMGLVGIREISVIETPPEGRLPIKTYLQPQEDRLLREAVLRELDRDGQVYVVHNKVATIEAMAEKIRQLVPEARLLVGHGQMDEHLLEQVMLKFAHHEADVLVCSTIIENGLDIPNVNTIVVNNAHRLGLTQLYQLRGRVGRSANQAYAYLLYPRDVHLSLDAMRRLEAVFEAQELGAGMSVAMKDLEIRGVGNLLGAEQSGQATAIGFDLYTRMIGEAVERLRGIPVEESASVIIDLPLTTYLPAEYVANEAERLTLYRRLAAVDSIDALESIASELADRFGAIPDPVMNLITSVRVKVAARDARVASVSLSSEALTIRSEPNGLYDRVSLYRAFGSAARINTNVLRIPRHALSADWLPQVQQILHDMSALRAALAPRQVVEV